MKLDLPNWRKTSLRSSSHKDSACAARHHPANLRRTFWKVAKDGLNLVVGDGGQKTTSGLRVEKQRGGWGIRHVDRVRGNIGGIKTGSDP